MKYFSTVALATLLTAGLAAPAAAQETSSAPYATEMGIQHSLLKDVGRYGKTGLLIDFGQALKTTGKMQTSVVGEVAFNHFSRFHETYAQAAGGIRIGAMATSKVRAFAQVMVGVQHEFGINGSVVQPGGGVSVRTSRNMDARVQVDFPILKWDGDTYKQFRFSAGIGLALGKK